ncbi:MAG: magnesium-protoporphyrin IX monomethyl ester (oxidative) cyclase [Deltaproteobacteria bacterium]|nr:magnesium-protoporphyrin IX monomethyl ester (oxidative) cyclase [Nannocystaceae bacterium]
MTSTLARALPDHDLSPSAAANDATLRAQETTTLSPRFYTTDVAAMNRLSADAVRPEWAALMAEFEADTNRGHFVRDGGWSFDAEALPAPLREELLDFMVSSLTAEFSGCLLYAELRRKGLNPDLKQVFKYMARDEARHAGFINECLTDLGIKVDMGFLVKSKKYTYFSPKFILYATYLSEKIGYARYIRIFRRLEQNPELRFHPIFAKFERWCADEFRHGEALALLMRGNPGLLRGAVNRAWIRFFQLAVFATMYIRDHARPEFHRALAVDPEVYGMEVFEIVSEISKQVFPVRIDIDNPKFLHGLRRLKLLAERIDAAKRGGGLWGRLRALPHQLLAGLTFVRMLLLPAKSESLPDQMRVAPNW